MFSLIDAINSDIKKNNIKLIDRICFLVDVKKEIYQKYQEPEFKKGIGKHLSSKQICVLCFYLKDSYPLAGYKVINTLLKIESGILANSAKDFTMPSEILSFLQQEIEAIQLPPINRKDLVNIRDWKNSFQSDDKSQDDSKFFDHIDMTFVKWNKTVSQAYSFVLKNNRLRPLTVIEVNQRVSLKRRLFNCLPLFARNLVLAFIRQRKKSEENKKGFLNIFHPTYELENIFDSQSSDLYTTESNEAIRANNINDSNIVESMRNGLGSVLLFTGGGIVRQNTFNSVSKKFIHMHPGLLPKVRGADCFFWSMLLDGFPSCSAMYQNTGIDTGEVIHEVSFEPPRFNDVFIDHLDTINRSKGDMLEIIYRSILNYYDPAMRAITLSGVLEKLSNSNKGIDTLAVRKQSYGEGRNYHFMHQTLRNKLIELMIERENVL